MTYRLVLSAEREEFDRQVRKRSPKYGYTYKPGEAVDVIVTHFYDVVIYYSSLLQAVANNGSNVSDSVAVMNTLNSNFSFYSPVNGLVQMDENGDRLMDYAMKKFSTDGDRFLVGLPRRFLRWMSAYRLPLQNDCGISTNAPGSA